MADPNLNLPRSASDILRHSHALFSAHLPTFLALSLLLFLFRTSVESGTTLLTSFVDQDPSLHALLSRLALSSSPPPSSSDPSSPLLSPLSSNQRRRRRRNNHRPFLQLTRVGTLDNGFFAEDENDERVLYGGSSPFGQKNVSFIRFGHSVGNQRLGLSGNVVDNGVELRRVVRVGVGFDFSNVSFEDEDGNGENGTNVVKEVEEVGDGASGDMLEQQNGVLVWGNLEIGRRDALALFFLVCLMSGAYGWVILGFLLTYCWVLGVVFVAETFLLCYSNSI